MTAAKRTTIEWLCALMTDREKIRFIDLLEAKIDGGAYNAHVNQMREVIDLVRGTLPEDCNERRWAREEYEQRRH